MPASLIGSSQPVLSPLVVIVGPTASGKTRFAIDLAEQIDGEIVGADSRQVYRGMDVGTAKPAPEQLRAVPHHLIDVVDPDQPFGLALYLDLAIAAIADIRRRGRVPILTGGTGQYIWAIVEGWQVPRVEPNTVLRATLARRAEAEGAAALHAELAQRDSVAAGAIHPNNVRRVIRALELLHETGEAPSKLRARRSATATAAVIGMDLDRQRLYAQIDQRVDEMFENGLVDEVESLLARGYDRSLPCLSGIGYTQVIQLLSGAIDLDAAIISVKTATHRLARQQSVWFRRDDPRITWLPPDGVEAAVVLIAEHRHRSSDS